MSPTTTSAQLELLAQKLDSFIDEERKWRDEMRAEFKDLDARVQTQERLEAVSAEARRGMQAQLEALQRLTDAKASAAELESLKGQVRLWSAANTLGAAVAATLAYFLKR